MRLNLTPRTLAIVSGCYLRGWVLLNFPGSTRAGPSHEVWILPSTSMPNALPVPSGDIGFPLIVRWDIWNRVVVPVVQGFVLPGDRSFLTLIDALEPLITGKLKDEGFIPG